MSQIGTSSKLSSAEFVKAMFNGWLNSIISVICIAVAGWVTFKLVNWGLLNSVWAGTAADCRAAGGACWAYLRAKTEFAVFGFFPVEERWRVVLGLVLLLSMVTISMMRRFWNKGLLVGWVGMLLVVFFLLRGGLLGLPLVQLRLWSGLFVTIWLSVVGIATAYPIGLLLALGRRSQMPLVRWFCIGWIELIRGVPLVSILIMGAVILPLFLPLGLEVENIVRAQVAITLFYSAYLAEVFRAGLQAIPKGQYEGADSLGLGYWQALGLIILPQALKLVIPAQVNTFIAIFKDTSLVLVIGLFDFLGTIKAMLSDTDWLGFPAESYLLGAVVYFVFSYTMSKYSQHLETQLNPEKAGRH